MHVYGLNLGCGLRLHTHMGMEFQSYLLCDSFSIYSSFFFLKSKLDIFREEYR